MPTNQLIRWSGLCLLLGGVGACLFWILHPEEPTLALNPSAWQLEHLLQPISLILLVPGLFGLYTRLAHKGGWLALVGFGLSFVGFMMWYGLSTIDAFIWPALARTAEGQSLILTPDKMAFNMESIVFGATFNLIVPGVLFTVAGSLLMGVAVMRSGTLPRWAGLLWAIGGVLYAVAPGVLPHNLLINLIAFSPFAVACAWLGWTLWADRSEVAAALHPAV